MTSLGELQARQVLQVAGLPTQGDIERAESVSNEVWLSDDYVIRLGTDPQGRLAREATVASALPPEVRYPTPLAAGKVVQLSYFVVRRVRGWPLSRVWPDLTADDRARATAQLGSMLRALHSTPTPAITPLADPPQPVGPHAGHSDHLEPLFATIERALQTPGVDQLLLHEAADVVRRTRACLARFPTDRMVHGDLTFGNLLWSEGEVVAMLDFEYARGAPSDVELDILLRMCAHPELFVDEAHAGSARSSDYGDVPRQLAEAHPDLFSAPSLRDRLRIYAIGFCARELANAGTVGPTASLPDGHPQKELAQLVSRTSHLENLLP